MHDLSVYENQPYIIHFDVDGGHPVAQFDMAYLVPARYTTCLQPPVPPELGGFVSADLTINVRLPLGTYYLCLRQQATLTPMPHITVHSTSAAPPRSPPPSPLPPPPPPPRPPPPLEFGPCFGELHTATSYTGATALSGFSSAVPNDPEARQACLADARCHAVVSSPLPIDPSLYRHVLHGANGTLTAGVTNTHTLLKETDACAPPGAPPAPPKRPPLLITNKIGFTALVQSTVETFDLSGYRDRMAVRLGLPVEQIEVSVSPGSVLVETVISVDSGATDVVDSIVQLQADTAGTTAMFGAPAVIDVNSISTWTLEPPAPPPEAPSSSSKSEFPWLWVGVAIGAAVLIGIVVAIVIWSQPRPTTIEYKPTPKPQAPEPDEKKPAAAAKTSRQLSYGRRSGMAVQQQLLRPEESAPYWWLSLQ